MPAPQGRPHARFEAQLSTLRSDEGGRHTPFVSGYRPQFYFRTTDVDGMLLLDSDSEMVLPGDTTAVTVELSKPVALNEGLGFAVREGGRTVAAGTIARLLG